MPVVQVLQSFIGTAEEVKKYGNPLGVIPWAIHHPVSGRKIRDNYIEMSQQRAEHHEANKVVRILNAAEVAALKDSKPAKGGTKDAVTKPASGSVDK